MSDEYQVGKGRPPRHSQFKPGQSGNPRGRPKGRQTAASALLAAMSETIVVTEGGRRRKVSKMEVIVTQLANRAAAGDRHAIRLALELTDQAEQRLDAKPPAAISPEQRRIADQKILAALRARLSPSTEKDDV